MHKTTASNRRLSAAFAVLLIAAIAFISFSAFNSVSTSAPAASLRLVQDDDNNNPEVAVVPGELSRLSWGAVIAGALLALILQLGFNLLGIGIGATTLEAATDDRTDNDPSGKSMARTAIVWIAFTTILSLVVGGWVAGRFAGIPSGLDGFLHGLLVWAVVTVITLIFLTSTVGRILSGTTSLINRGLSLASKTAGAVTQGAANIVQGAAGGLAHAAAGAANTASDAANNPSSPIGQVVNKIEDTVRGAIDQLPEVKDILDRQNLSMETIQHEAETLMRQAGIAPQHVQGEAQAAVGELKDAAQQAVQQVQHDPQEAIKTMSLALCRVFRQGQSVVSEADRQALLDVIRSRGGKNQQEAEALLAQWEDNFNRARQETERVRTEAQQKLEKAQKDVQQKAEQAKADAERMAKEAANATTKAISRLAIAVFAVMLIGAIAAGVGGLAGAPQELPTAEVDTTTSYSAF